MLPKNLHIKNLNMSHLNEIYKLLLKNYFEDDQKIFRRILTKKYLYWYLKKIESRYMIGLIYKKRKLIGLITAIIVDIDIYGEKTKMPYINFNCIQRNIYNKTYEEFLINNIIDKLYKDGYKYIYYKGMIKSSRPQIFKICTIVIKKHTIPINCTKLSKIFDVEILENIPEITNNPLHILTKKDLPDIIDKLNNNMSNYYIKPLLSIEIATHFFLPIKNLVYSYIIRNETGNITDFICAYNKYYYHVEKNVIIKSAQLFFLFSENILNLITFLLDKLKSEYIDQLEFNITKNNNKLDLIQYDADDNILHSLLYKESIQTLPESVESIDIYNYIF